LLSAAKTYIWTDMMLKSVNY